MKRQTLYLLKTIAAIGTTTAATVATVAAIRKRRTPNPRRAARDGRPDNDTPHDDNTEMLPLVDPAGNVIGQASRGHCHDGSGLLHPVVHLHVFDLDGKLYLQRRPMWKEIQPGKWDTAVGGHISMGETPHEALAREAAEELGLTDFRFRHLDTYVHESAVERELVYVYRCTYAGCPHPTAELDGGRFMPAGHIRRAADAHSLTPNFASEYARLFPLDIRRATEADIPTLRRLAEATFVPTYRPILTPEQLDYMMEWMYSADSLHQQMASGHAFYLAEDEDGPCGYVSIEQQAEGLFHLQKLYVHPSRQKRGYGQRLFMQAADYATALTDGPCRIELNVNRDNPALHFYEHLGMRRDRCLDTPIGSGYYMNDYIMALDLADGSLPEGHPMHYDSIR